MTHEDWKNITEGIVALLLIGRGVMSHFEHKKTKDQIGRIEISINGELYKRLNAERELGRLQGIEESKNKK